MLNGIIRLSKFLVIFIISFTFPSTLHETEIKNNTIDYNINKTDNIPTQNDIKEEIKEEVKEKNKDAKKQTNNVPKKNDVIKEEIKQVQIPVQEEVKEEAKVLDNSIKINNILNKPLLKDNDGSHFYLNHNINGKYDGIGVPYIDYRTNFKTRKTIIYAHSNKNGSGPFNVLQKYHNNKSFYQQNPFIKVTYDNKIYTYQIFSVYVSTANSEEDEGLKYFHKMNYTNDEWEIEIQNYKNNSEYETNVDVSKNDKILILQTCSMDNNYYEKYYRFNLLIMAKLISIE